MPYTPPVGTVDLSIGSVLGYTPPIGTADLSVGHSDFLDRQGTLIGETAAPIGQLTLLSGRVAALTGVAPSPLGQLRIRKVEPIQLLGTAAAPMGLLQVGEPQSIGLSGATRSPLGQLLVKPGQIVTLHGVMPSPMGELSISPPRRLTLIGATVTPLGAITLVPAREVAMVGATTAPMGLIALFPMKEVALTGMTTAPMGLLDVAYDPNLLSAVTVLTTESWQAGLPQRHPGVTRWQTSLSLRQGFPEHWGEALDRRVGTAPNWTDAQRSVGRSQDRWQTAQPSVQARQSHWQTSPSAHQSGVDGWQASEPQTKHQTTHWRDLPLALMTPINRWQDGGLQTQQHREGFTDGELLIAVEIEVWQKAGYPGNADNPDKDDPDTPVRPPWGTRLRLVCRLPGTRLSLRRTPCILIAEREIPVRRTYMSVNSASLVRWPDLTPLPCTSLTLETDFESWCWGLSATLAGPDAWALVQPNPLACEVLATINGQQWKCLLDVPSTQRSFNSDRVSLKGRSRSAWLHEPYTRSQDFTEANARTMQQLGEAALLNTGWTLNWQSADWLVPAGRYNSWNTPMGALIRLAQVTDDGLYTDPVLQVITLQKRWPVPSWLLDAETADLAIPESAVISLSQAPIYTAPYNGVYVSGISHGALALVKIAGTDGALQPPEPITHELLCDDSGVAARQRGLNFLSDSGAGYELDAELLFTPEVGLVRPGLIVSIAGVKGISRSCRISAQWGGDGLTIRQSVGLERREAESA